MELLSGLLAALRGAPRNREFPRVMEDRALEVYDIIRNIRDPEKPSTLEDLEVVSESCVSVQELDEDCFLVIIRFTPTVPHCSLATLIGLCLRVKLQRCLSFKHKVLDGTRELRYHGGMQGFVRLPQGRNHQLPLPLREVRGLNKLEIYISEGTHSTEEDINKQINDKERVSAAMENPSLREIVEQCVTEPD